MKTNSTCKSKGCNKATISVLLIIAMIFSMMHISGFNSDSYAAAKGKSLITVGGKTVTSDMKISDVSEMFGKPKLKTDNYYGGKAYTFYGKNYKDFLYLETDKNGKISCYGSVTKDFKTSIHSYGDKEDYIVHNGYDATYKDKIIGVLYYVDTIYDAYEKFNENLVENNRNLCKHATEMFNAVAYIHGNDTSTYFDEELFEINAQLAMQGYNLDEYCSATGCDYYRMTSGSTMALYNPTPLYLAHYATSYKCPEGYAMGGIIYHPSINDEYDYCMMGFIDPQIRSEWNSIEYSDAEKEKLKIASQYLQKSSDEYNESEKYYEIEPEYSGSASEIRGGKLSEGIAKGTVDFLNAVRTGCGLSPVEYDSYLSECAQAKATYTVFLSENGISCDDPHNPPKIDGLKDDFYEMCQYGGGENLFFTGIVNDSVLFSVMNALSDDYGVGQHYSRGHRRILLSPSVQKIGVGCTDHQGCHKMTGSGNCTADVVAWPANGITLAISGFQACDMWTCEFYNGLTATDNTTVTIKCLNNGEEWFIDSQNLNSNQDYNGDGSLISFADSSISMRLGGVYEITIDHLNNENGEDTSYTYRSVYESGDDDSDTEGKVKSIAFKSSDTTVDIGSKKQLNVKISPLDADNRRLYFTSENPEIATVTAYGEVKGIAEGTTTIIATSEDGNFTSKCKVTVKKHEHTHSYSVAWSNDETNHWHACTVCGAKKDNAAHTDSDKNEKCDTCDYNMHFHSGTKVAQVDATCSSYGVKAYYKCSCGKYYTDSACTKEITDLAAWKSGDGRIEKIEHTLKTTTTKATTSKNGKKETKCRVCGKVTKTETIYAAKTIKLSTTKYTYDGKVKKPSVTIKDSKGNAIASTNYTVTYPSGRKNVGKYTVKVTFKGNYSGSKNLSFTINPPKTSISKVTAGKKAFTVKWTKKTTQVTGYEIQYSTSSTFAKGNKNVKVTSAKTASKTISKLTGGKKYYVRIRTYKRVGKTPYYSDWSAKKSVTTNPPKTSISKVTAGKKAFTVKWTKKTTQVTGYEIQYSTSSTFAKGNKNVKVTSAKTASKTISKLTGGKKYYVRIRTYKTVGKTPYYSDWSAKKSVTTKK